LQRWVLGEVKVQRRKRHYFSVCFSSLRI